jgi:hypothetical protein
MWSELRRAWHKPSDLGVRLTMIGIVLLFTALIMNRIVPSGTYKLETEWGWAALWAYILIEWVIYIVGSILVCVGTFRIFATDHP